MNRLMRTFVESFKPHPFQFKHIAVLFVIIIVFQVIVAFLHKTSLEKFLSGAQSWYQQDSAERLATLTATSLELLLETRGEGSVTDESEAKRLVQGLNIILSQQILNQNVKQVCVLIRVGGVIHAIDDGQILYDRLYGKTSQTLPPDTIHRNAIALYDQVHTELVAKEEVRTIVENKQTFHVFVPFVLRGEVVGAMYMENSPDFSFITRGVTTSYDETAITFSALILFGLLAMFYISSHTVKDRNETLQLLFDKEKQHLSEQIEHRKELMFTKRIYHTHHKAEKVMGFINEDLRGMTTENMDAVRERVRAYANFVSRVIYDMKWYDPPVQTVRGQLFRTNINTLLTFLVRNVFQRVATPSGPTTFVLDLDEHVPSVPVNEFVAWEAFEPIIQNGVEHAGVRDVRVCISTRYDPAANTTTVSVADNGVGVHPELLEKDEQGIRRIFLEDVSTKSVSNRHSGYGCYIARQIAVDRCGWECDVENMPEGGCRFSFFIPHT